MIGRRGLAPRHPRERHLGERGLEREHELGLARGVGRRLPPEREQTGHVLHVVLADRVGAGPHVGVVVPVGQAEAALRQPGEVVRRVVGVGGGRIAERHVDALPLQRGDLRHETRACRDPRDRGEPRPRGGHPHRLGRRRVHARAVKRAEFAACVSGR